LALAALALAALALVVFGPYDSNPKRVSLVVLKVAFFNSQSAVISRKITELE